MECRLPPRLTAEQKAALQQDDARRPKRVLRCRAPILGLELDEAATRTKEHYTDHWERAVPLRPLSHLTQTRRNSRPGLGRSRGRRRPQDARGADRLLQRCTNARCTSSTAGSACSSIKIRDGPASGDSRGARCVTASHAVAALGRGDVRVPKKISIRRPSSPPESSASSPPSSKSIPNSAASAASSSSIAASSSLPSSSSSSPPSPPSAPSGSPNRSASASASSSSMTLGRGAPLLVPPPPSASPSSSSRRRHRRRRRRRQGRGSRAHS